MDDAFSNEPQLHYSSSSPSLFPYTCYFSEPIPDFSTTNLETTTSMVYSYSHSHTHSHSHSPIMVLDDACADKKRPIASQEGIATTTSLISSGSAQQPKDGSGSSKSRKLKRSNGSEKLQGGEAKKARGGHGDAKAKEASPAAAGYIHVRARRGQATDSHSLAERVRREKISKRMKMLQSLVPGCDKVIGKATMLDEIINYVQSLQNQVEFLSMKLASMNPMLYEFGVDIDGYPNFPEDVKMRGSVPDELVQWLGQGNHVSSRSDAQHTPFDGAATTPDFQLATNTHAPHFSSLLHGPTPFPQDGSSCMMPPPNEVEFNTTCSFQ